MGVVFVAWVVVRHGRLRRHGAAMFASWRKLRQLGHNRLVVARVVVQIELIGIVVISLGDGRSRLGVMQRTRSKAMRSPVFCWSSR